METFAEVELDIKDESNPNSLINMLPSTMSNALKAIPDKLLVMPEEEIKRFGRIGITEERLRHSFWIEYGHASLGGRKINMPQVYNGVCRKEQWYQQIVTNSYKMAYILTPPPSYRVTMVELLDRGLEAMRDILSAPHRKTNKDGVEIIDTKLAGVKAKIVDTLLDRVHGAAVQKVKVDTRSVNVNVDVPETKTAESIEELDARIAELERMKALPARKVIDVKKEDDKA